MRYSALALVALATILFVTSGCADPRAMPSADASNTSSEDPSTVLVSVTSDIDTDPQKVDMALKIAGFSLDEGRKVALFFNVKGVNVPHADLDESLAFQDQDPFRTQLQQLIEKGAEVHVCPICMKSLGVEESHLMEGAQVTTRPGLFAHIGGDTAVFTY